MTTTRPTLHWRMLTAAILASSSALPATAITVEAQSAPSRLVLRVHEVKCINETGSSNIGADEIDLAGIAILPDGQKVRLRTLDLGQFNHGTVKRPTRDFASFDLKKGPAFPRMYQAMLILAERDHGAGLGDALDGIVEDVKPASSSAGTSATAAAAAVATASLTRDPGPIAEEALKAATALAEKWSKDDIFKPRLTKVQMRNPNTLPQGLSQTPKDTIDLRQFDGHYRIVYSWRLVP